MSAAPIQLRVWQDVLRGLRQEQADWHKLSAKDRDDLMSKLAHAQTRILYYERAVNLEKKASAAEFEEVNAEIKDLKDLKKDVA